MADLTALKHQLYTDLQRLLWAMTWDIYNPERWQLEPDEIFAELCLELVKTAERYPDKTYHELKSLAVRCCRNRAYDLVELTYNTHRKAEGKQLSLDDEDNPVDVGSEQQYFDLTDLMARLSPDAQRLVQEILEPSQRAQYIFELSRNRRLASNPQGNWSMEVTPALMQRALGWPEFRLNSAWNEVTQAVQRF